MRRIPVLLGEKTEVLYVRRPTGVDVDDAVVRLRVLEQGLLVVPEALLLWIECVLGQLVAGEAIARVGIDRTVLPHVALELLSGSASPTSVAGLEAPGPAWL